MSNKYSLTYRPLMARDARRAMHGTIGTSRRGSRPGTSFDFEFLERVRRPEFLIVALELS